MTASSSIVVSDLATASPAQAVSRTPAQDRWMVLPYEGDEVSGTMLWSPARHRPPHVTIKLPAAGRCRIYVGVYGSGTWQWWLNVFSGRYTSSKAWVRVRLRLSDEEFFDTVIPENYPDEPRLGYISETLWRTADLRGQSLVLSRDERDSMMDTTACLAYVRLVPTDQTQTWPKQTKRLYAYFDSNYEGHFPDSAAELQGMIQPLRNSDFHTVFWTTCREDTCYYPTTVGNLIPHDTPTGVYPYWAGRDVRRLLDAGHDPLRLACDVAHECGLKLFASYRRMTCRMPPFIFPLHPAAMMANRHDLWCADRDGSPIPHLSLAYPDVRQRMIDLLVEQATRYDIDGVHFYFSRSVPFTWYERPVVDEFRRLHGEDARRVDPDDPRLSEVRSGFFCQWLREVRSALAAAGRPLPVALHAQNTVGNCLHYGIDVAALAREGLVDIFLPDHGHFLPDRFGQKVTTPEATAEFVKLARGTAMRIAPVWADDYRDDKMTRGQIAQAFYNAGVDGLHVSAFGVIKSEFALWRRMGHLDELDRIDEQTAAHARLVRIRTFAGMTIDLTTGVTTCG